VRHLTTNRYSPRHLVLISTAAIVIAAGGCGGSEAGQEAKAAAQAIAKQRAAQAAAAGFSSWEACHAAGKC
jgi:hypothetical protein